MSWRSPILRIPHAGALLVVALGLAGGCTGEAPRREREQLSRRLSQQLSGLRFDIVASPQREALSPKHQVRLKALGYL